MNINKASEKDLESLPGIDEAAARRIVDDRPYDDRERPGEEALDFENGVRPDRGQDRRR